MKKQSIASGEADFVTALLSAEMIQAMDRYIWEEAPGMTRSDVLKEAFNEWCIKRSQRALSPLEGCTVSGTGTVQRMAKALGQ